MQDGRGPVSELRNEPFADPDDPVVGAVALAVLGAGLGSLFGLPLLDAVEFWVIFAIGYAVVVPLTSLVRSRGDNAGTDSPPDRQPDTERVTDAESGGTVDAALDRLRERYASGELSETQFERKLEALLETETPEDARERLDRWVGGTDARTDSTERERERDR